MIVLLFALAGAALGALTARRRQGNRLDMLQFAAVYGIVAALAGLALTIVLLRTGG